MKNLELNLKKRLIIEEFDTVIDMEIEFQTYKAFPGEKTIICRGSDLNEEIAAGIVNKKQVFDTPAIFFFKDSKSGFGSCITARQSFVSAIEAKGWHWGKKFFEADSRTFHPERVIIFEIVEG